MEKKAVKKIEWQAWMDLDRSICFNVHCLLLLFAEHFVISLMQLWRRRWWWHGNAWRRKRRSLITILSPGQEAETKDFHRETCCKALCINFSARPCHPCRRNVRVVERCLGWEWPVPGQWWVCPMGGRWTDHWPGNQPMGTHEDIDHWTLLQGLDSMCDNPI